MQHLNQRDLQLLDMVTQNLEDMEANRDYLFPAGKYYLLNDRQRSQPKSLVELMQTLPRLVEAGELVEYGRKDTGALFAYDKGDTRLSYATVNYLLNLPCRRKLKDAQLHEVENLLKKAGRSLEIDMPPLPSATDTDIMDAFAIVIKKRIMDNPVIFYRELMDTLNRNGTPIDLKQKDFKKFVEENLKL